MTFVSRDSKDDSAENKLESSANRWKSNKFEQLEKSLIYKRKRSGPRTEPWGTPHEMTAEDEVVLPIDTDCDLLDK